MFQNQPFVELNKIDDFEKIHKINNKALVLESLFIKFRSSPSLMFVKIGVLKNFVNFTEITCVRGDFM